FVACDLFRAAAAGRCAQQLEAGRVNGHLRLARARDVVAVLRDEADRGRARARPGAHEPLPAQVHGAAVAGARTPDRLAHVRVARGRVAESAGAPLPRRDRPPDRSASTNAHAAPINRIWVECALANGPAISTPRGTVPPNAMIHSAMTRPRSSLRSCFCRIVD